MAVGAGVRSRAVVPQGRVALTALGWGQGDGVPELTVWTAIGRTEGARSWDKPTTHWTRARKHDQH